MVAGGRDVVTDFPTDRGWDWRGSSTPTPTPQASRTRAPGVPRRRRRLRPRFFGVAPTEALAMDPQQRLFLELAWERLERGGIDPTSLRGSATGVFAGVYAQGYGIGADGAEGFRLTGQASSVASGRVSYVLGLEGPAVSVDTACSSSLSPCTWRCRRCGPVSATSRWQAASPSTRPPTSSSSSAGSAGCPPTAAARRSPARPTAPDSPRAAACSSSSGSRTRSGSATRCSPRPRLGDQPGRRVQRAHRAERPVPAARGARRAGQRRTRPVGRRRRRGPRHRHHARRSHRGAGAAGDLRAGPAASRCGWAR